MSSDRWNRLSTPNIGIIIDIIKHTSDPPARGELNDATGVNLLNLANCSAATRGFSCLVVRLGRGYSRVPDAAISVPSGLHSAPTDVEGP
jgi:hypothetical protein